MEERIRNNEMTNEQFNSGTGTMPEHIFDGYVELVGLDQAIWVAKYFGVALNTVKEWAKKHLH